MTKSYIIAKWYFNGCINQSDYSFFWQLEPNEKPSKFSFGQETKNGHFPPNRLATPIQKPKEEAKTGKGAMLTIREPQGHLTEKFPDVLGILMAIMIAMTFVQMVFHRLFIHVHSSLIYRLHPRYLPYHLSENLLRRSKHWIAQDHHYQMISYIYIIILLNHTV